MNEWPLVLTAIGTLAALGALGHRVMVQILGRIDSVATIMAGQLTEKFEESERRRVDGAALWQERLALRDQTIEAIRRDHLRTEQSLAELADNIAKHYALRDSVIEIGGVMSRKLDRIYERSIRPPTGLEASPPALYENPDHVA